MDFIGMFYNFVFYLKNFVYFKVFVYFRFLDILSKFQIRLGYGEGKYGLYKG